MASARAHDTDLKSKSISILNFWLDSIRFDFHWCNVLNPWYLSCFLLLYRCQFFFLLRLVCDATRIRNQKTSPPNIIMDMIFGITAHTLSKWFWHTEITETATAHCSKQQKPTDQSIRFILSTVMNASSHQFITKFKRRNWIFFLGELFSFMLLHFQWHRLSFPCLCCFKYLLVDLCWFLLATSWRAVQFIMIKYGTLAQLENSSTRYFASIITY